MVSATRADGTRLEREERRWVKVLSTLNEAQARWFVADKALDLGHGGISRLSQVTGMSRTTITKAIEELRGRGALGPIAMGRIRREGAGRKRLAESDPEVKKLIVGIVEETTAGDPMSLLRWTSKSTRTIAEELARRGHPIDAVTVGRCLSGLGYSLQANVKAKEGPQHAARDEQFRYINRLVKAYIKAGDPVISVDTKKKELVGEFRNAGRTWRPRGEPLKVNVHDFPHLGRGKAVPYGAYDIARNRAVVNVGVSHDTAEFAVESIRRWWRLDGRRIYRHARKLLICADSGGSNGHKLRAQSKGQARWCPGPAAPHCFRPFGSGVHPPSGPSLRFLPLLIEPDLGFSHIRLSDRFHTEACAGNPRWKRRSWNTPSSPKTRSAGKRFFAPRAGTLCLRRRKWRT